MYTRLLETNQVIRGCVNRFRVLEANGNSLILKTSTDLSKTSTDLSLQWDTTPIDREMIEHSMERKPGERIEGLLQIDLLTDTLIRIRYREGLAIPENDTPMVVGKFNGPENSRIETTDDRVILSTGKIRVIVNLLTYSIDVQKRDQTRICSIGGAEKNYFFQWDAFNTGICRSFDEEQRPLATECFDLSPYEAVYGFGEKFIRLNKIGQTIDLNMLESLGCTTPRSYKNIPFFMSTRGYGVFLNHSCPITCWVGSMHAAELQVAAEDDFLDYYLMTGSIKEILSQYTEITGKGDLPPLWSFGYWQSKISYKSAEETLDIVKKLREHKIPCDVLHLDTHWFKVDWYCDLEFDKERFPDPEGYLNELAGLGINVSLWQLPYIPEGCRLFDELKAAGGFVKTKDGEIYDVGISYTIGFQGTVGCIDYTNPKAREVHQNWLRKLLKMGVKVIKVDFGEEAPVDGVYFDGTPGHRMHNLYPLLYNQAMAEVTKEASGESIIWARSAWAGSQRYPVHWGGDSSANFDNMIPQIEGGLSFGLSGFQFWSQDIGGFLGEPSGNLLIRWMQFGMFLSHTRIHGTGDREIYKFDPETLRICRDYIRLRYRLLPYIYGSAMESLEKSLPMARALVVEYQDDPTVWHIGHEYLFGSSLLVAPITDETNQRMVYMPEGTWTDWWTGERINGNRWIPVAADIETLPLYIREGGIIPMGPVMNYVGEIETKEIALRIGRFEGDGESCFTVPIDNEKVPVRYTASGGKHQVRVGPSKAVFKIESLDKTDENVDSFDIVM